MLDLPNFNFDLSKDLLIGIAAGDCLGVTSEFYKFKIEHLYKQYKKLGWPFQPVGRKKWKFEPGEHTDDTDMAWAIFESVYSLKCFDPVEIANNFVNWFNTNPKDIGTTTRNTLEDIKSGTKWNEAGYNFWNNAKESAANGSLMRNGVICGFTNDLDEAFEMTILHGMITHYGPLPQLCCCAHTWVIFNLLRNNNPLLALDWIDKFYEDWINFLKKNNNKCISEWLNNSTKEEIEKAIKTIENTEWSHYEFNPFECDIDKSGGYCVLTLQIAFWAFQWSLESSDAFIVPKCLLNVEEPFYKTGVDRLGWIPLIGYDADTYGATAGPLFVAHYKKLPHGMTSNLQIHEWIKNL